MLYDSEIYGELKSDFKKDKSKNKIGFFTILVLVFFLSIPICFFLLTRKPHSYVSSLNNLPAPSQFLSSWSFEMTAFWRDLVVDFISGYDIYWKVIAVRKFKSVTDFSDKISPYNFVLWWWFMWIQDNVDKFVWDSSFWSSVIFGDFDHWNVDWFNNVWWNLGVASYYSNNRLIPSSRMSKISLSKIDEWDFVRIKWYLSRVRFSHGWFDWWPNCSDNPMYSCNVIFVTDVTWLKEH